MGQQRPRDRYVVVASTPRSGSSWLSRLLRSHPDLAVYTHNTGDNYRLYLLDLIRSLSPFSDDTPGRPAAAAVNRRARLVRRLFPPSGDARLAVIQTPTLGPFLPYFVAALPQARFVHLRRDPLDTIASLRSHMASTTQRSIRTQFGEGRYRGWSFASRSAAAHLFHKVRWIRSPHGGYLFARPSGFQRFVRSPAPDFHAHYYAAYESDIHSSLAKVPSGRLKVLEYESLVTSFEETFEGLLDFMGVRPLDVPERRSLVVRTQSLGRHRRDLTEAEIERIRQILAQADPRGEQGATRR